MKKGFSQLLFLYLLFVNLLPCQAQPNINRLDSLFDSLHQKSKFNGNVLIAQNGAVLYQRSFGFADRAKKIRNTATSRFHLASTSKLFTAVAILQLKEKGLIKLNDPVVRYLPDFPYSGITIRHLLTHTAGLPDFQIFEPYYQENPRQILTSADLIPALKRYGKVLFEPGEKWSYSSPGTALLAVIIEKVTRLKLEQYLKQYIWDKSGMHHTYINSLSAWVKDEKRVKNYARTTIFSDSVQIAESIPKHREFAQISGALIGPGLVVSDADDLFLFDQALYAGKLLRTETMNEAFTPIKLNNGTYAQPEPFLGKTAFGLGWFLLAEDPARKIVLHTGKQGGIVTIFVRDVTQKRTYILLDNSESPGLSNTTLNAMRILDNRPLLTLKESLAFTYAQDITKRGIDFALSHFNQVKTDTAHYYLNLFEMDYVGHQLIAHQRAEQGLETLRLLTQMNTDNWFPYYSYGKELVALGKKEEAAMNLKKSLLLSPENQEVKQVLEQLKGN
ncbi:serine hydrolase domain-containing protein [Adhaeribacter pallidiroseus]|uniref:Penicillin-binding protein 4 n=1 Tax=Adhaeribacter pallidiroseus TaxID=2072847 RepID=A0A369QJT2_9BACT|nr:serine hydrolase domain-containing protein [Adhaeribacter pallidiroseus]RDC62518.1 Penicillin-binding protein 4* [Adhaeribacter pallidiroseus]